MSKKLQTMTLGEFRTLTKDQPDDLPITLLGYRNEKPEALCEIKVEQLEEEEHDSGFFHVLAEGEKGAKALVLQ